MTRSRMLAITHEATITGAPMNLLHLLTWIRRNEEMDVHLLVLRDGPLRHRFEEVCDVTVMDRSSLDGLLGVIQDGLIHLGSTRAWKPLAAARFWSQLRHLEGFDLVYANSIASSAVLPFLSDGPVVVSHVHELQVALRTWRPPEFVRALDDVPDAWIAASDAVRTCLVEERGYPPDRVLLHHEFIDTTAITDRVVPLREVERIRRSLRIPSDAAVVMGAGTVEWRKGPDLFVQLAAEVRRRTREPVHFVWVGGDLTGTDWQRVLSDIERTGSDHVHFVGVKTDPVPWFAAADVFALTSREDPFPLVCLENAARGTPIVTYRNGGMPELLEAAGSAAAAGVIDHLDVEGLADATLDLLGSDDLSKLAAQQVRDRVIAHHDVSVAAPKLVRDLYSLSHRDQPERMRSHRPSSTTMD